ncbi:hypothetical protein UPYG_G00245730 [Umbra pygmaea]|uniref:Zinc finger protein 865 n=1 Tax=Umbra pygmaea TaxID=75934 RepID=A0ABD0WL20_UMBPY
MTKLQSFRAFLNQCLMAAAVEIFGAFEEMTMEYQEENNRLRRILRIAPEIRLCGIDALQFSVSEEEVPPEQQHCEQEWSPSLGQEDPEPTQIKEEQEEICIPQAEYPNVNRLKMSEQMLFHLFLNKHLTKSVVEIFGAVEKTVAVYQEEKHWLQRMLKSLPEIKLSRIDSIQFSLSEEEVPPEQQHCEQELSPSLEQEDLEPTQIKEEQEELRTSQEEEQLQGLLDTKDSILTPPCVKSECDQENPLWSLTEAQTQTEENREIDSKQVDLRPADTVTHLNCLDFLCDPPDLNPPLNPSSLLVLNPPLNPSSLLDLNPPLNPSSLLVLNPPLNPNSLLDLNPPLNPSLPLDLNPPVRIHRSKRNTTSSKTHICQDCGEAFHLQADLQSHVTLAKKTSSKCVFCKKWYKSSCKLKAHVRLCHSDEPSICPFCSKIFKQKSYLTVHIRLHTGDEPFSCDDCGRRFNQKWQCNVHKQMHKGQKQFSCDECGKHFSLKGNLTVHKLTHTGEKPFSCADCGKRFSVKDNLNKHKLIHTGKKSFSCDDCGKSFRLKGALTVHKLTHTGEKPYSCAYCGKCFNVKDNLNKHELIHTENKSFTCDDCGKSFRLKGNLTTHQLTHTGEKPHVCPMCAKGFTLKVYLKSHLENVHTKKDKKRGK